jgi:transcriptional regulator with XRE-family HTH domain
MSQPPSPSRQRLAAILRRLRDDSGMSTYQLADVLGWTQSRVTRIERGQISVTADDANAWAEVTHASERVREELSELAYEAWTHARSWRTSHRRGLAARQREMGSLERSCPLIRQFQPEAIPGLLQSPAYARHVITMADITGQRDVDAAVEARMERQKILREPGHQFQYVLVEGALRWRPGPAEIMAEQRDHLLAAARLPGVSIAVIPFDQQARAPYIHPFTIYDSPDAPLVLIEQYTREMFIDEAPHIAVYQRTFDLLRESALTGASAADFIRSVLS